MVQIKPRKGALYKMVKKNRYCLLLMCLSAPVVAQECNENALRDTPDSQFEVNGDEVLDLKTGLTWKRCSVGQDWDGTTCSGSPKNFTWEGALEQAANEWRVPNVKELTSIIEASCVSPAINVTVFPNTPGISYWTSSPIIRDHSAEFAWSVLFDVGAADIGDKLYWPQPVRLVKD